MPSSLAATDAADTVPMRLVLLSSWTWFRTHHGPNGTGRGGRTAALKFYELRDNLLPGNASRTFVRRQRSEAKAPRFHSLETCPQSLVIALTLRRGDRARGCGGRQTGAGARRRVDRPRRDSPAGHGAGAPLWPPRRPCSFRP